jgi:hypothetical protein
MTILIPVLIVLFTGHISTPLSAQDTTFTATGSGRDHGYEMIEGFELIHPAPDRVPFGEGEYLLFGIQYGLIHAGDATLEVRSGSAELRGRKAYHLVSVARTNKAFDVIYKVRDRHESFMDREMLYSLRFEKHLREGKFRRDKEVDFDQEKRLAIYAEEQVGIPPNTQDFISALYYVRTIPLEPGQAVFMANHSDGKNYPIFVKALRRESVKVPAGEFDCLVIEPVLETSAIFENTGKLTIWLTDDNLRMPVLMRSKVMVGSFEAVLKEYTLSGEEPRILIEEGKDH